MTSAAGNAIGHEAIHALGQICNAVAFNPTAMIVEMAETIEVMNRVRNSGTTRWL